MKYRIIKTYYNSGYNNGENQIWHNIQKQNWRGKWRTITTKTDDVSSDLVFKTYKEAKTFILSKNHFGKIIQNGSEFEVIKFTFGY